MSPFRAMTRRLLCYFIFEELITKMPPKRQFGATEADFTTNSDTFFGKPCLYYCSLHHVCSMHYVLPELRPHVVFHECLFQTNQEIAIIHKRQLTPPCIRLGVKNWKKISRIFPVMKIKLSSCGKLTKDSQDQRKDPHRP